MKEDDLLNPDRLMDMLKNDRGYASFFAPPINASSKGKAIYELGVANDLIKSHIELQAVLPYMNPKISEADPPDCVAEGNIAIEITELVNEHAVGMNARIKQGRAGKNDFKCYGDWNESLFKKQLLKIIAKKDSRKLLGGPYTKYILIMSTDEFLLEYKTVKKWTQNMKPAVTNLLDRIYLLFSYKPQHIPAYPFIEIPITKEK
ncbi:hypothetical protein [Maridesulfovibrio sp.]|uniref:hypothetical protein n=1 Tax=Maridesulfovibrio sp. TaxID=2795000 RepID=UPI0029F57784|nr:hypothetical protein [Maridesulfovibrio sp.]